MNKIIILGLMVVATLQTQAQSIQKSVIGSSGNVTNNSGIILRSTIGETATSSYANGSIKITQGFQQNIIASTPLPITGLVFNGKRLENSKVELKWRTLSEYQNKGFYVERKQSNESAFSTIGFVESLTADVSKTELKYQFWDENVYTGLSYYRIKQVDFNGKFEYSKIIAINKFDTYSNLKLYPNPAISVLNIENMKGNTVEIANISGQKTIYNVLKKSELQSSIDVSNLPKGLYFLKAGNEVSKFLKQ